LTPLELRPCFIHSYFSAVLNHTLLVPHGGMAYLKSLYCDCSLIEVSLLPLLVLAASAETKCRRTGDQVWKLGGHGPRFSVFSFFVVMHPFPLLQQYQ
jgi:hypothetical protein